MERLYLVMLACLMTLTMRHAAATEPQAENCEVHLAADQLSPSAQAYLNLVKYYLTHAPDEDDKFQVLDQIHASEKFINPFRSVRNDSLSLRIGEAVENIRLRAKHAHINWQVEWPKLRIELSALWNNNRIEQQDRVEKALITAGMFRPKVLTPVKLKGDQRENLTFDYQGGPAGSEFLFFDNSGDLFEAGDLYLYGLNKGGITRHDRLSGDALKAPERRASQTAFHTTSSGRRYLAMRVNGSHLQVYEIVQGKLRAIDKYYGDLKPNSRIGWFESKDGRLFISVSSSLDDNIHVLKLSEHKIHKVGVAQTVSGVHVYYDRFHTWHEDERGNIHLLLVSGGGGGLLRFKVNNEDLESFPPIYDLMKQGSISQPSLYSDSTATYLAVGGSDGQTVLFKITETGLERLQTLETERPTMRPQWHKSAEGHVFLAVASNHDNFRGRVDLYEFINEKLQERGPSLIEGTISTSPSWFLTQNGESYLAMATDVDNKQFLGKQNNLTILQLNGHYLDKKLKFLTAGGTRMPPLWMVPKQNTGTYVTAVSYDYLSQETVIQPFRIIENLSLSDE